jgi:hypothetical protein
MRAPSPQYAIGETVEVKSVTGGGPIATMTPSRVMTASEAAREAEPNRHPPRDMSLAPQLPQTGFANIATAISAIMSEIGVVGEGGENKFQNYKYMSYKDMYRKLTPLMGKHGLAVIPTEKSKNLFDNDAVVMGTYQFTVIHKSGEVWPFQPEWTGVSRARDSKGGFDDKALNKCATAAQKYFLKALFQIPSGEDDEDPDNHDGIVPRETKVRAPSPPKAEPASPFKARGKDENEWTADLLRLINEAKSTADLNAVDQANAEASDRLSLKFPELYRKAYDAFVLAKKKFVKADPISSGPSLPRHEDDPLAFKNAVIDLMDTAQTYPGLELIYNTHVAPLEKDMFPVDRDDCISAFRRNENRLSP